MTSIAESSPRQQQRRALDLGSQKLTPLKPDLKEPTGDWIVDTGPRYLHLRRLRASERGQFGGGGPRGQISIFSAASWRRFGKALGSIDTRLLQLSMNTGRGCGHGDRLLALVLTHGSDYPSSAESKRCFRAWKERMRRKKAKVLVWKREYQLRGAPHWHVVIQVPYTWSAPVLIEDWLAIETTGATAAGQWHEDIDDAAGLCRYLLKDAAKGLGHAQHQTDDPAPGRWWWISPTIPRLRELKLLAGVKASAVLALVWEAIPRAALESIWFARSWRASYSALIFT